MNTESFSEARIIESWHINAMHWTAAVREGQIDSRKQITDQAVIDAVISRLPRSVLDIGCGEGWLVRELAARKILAVGTDVVTQLVEEARNASEGDFRMLSYEEIAAGKLNVLVDSVVCNFSLLGKESVEGIFKVVPSMLNSNGTFIIQTLHPAMTCGDLPYRDGWREGSWAGFSADFSNPAPWYFRTLESWVELFAGSGFRLLEVREPPHPTTQKPASIIFIGEAIG